ncbi:MAG: 8-oxo-dGTP diphosphatase [Treponema sp.]|nr:8-oxo-dGTP diphosphatase [Treponema sp.]
MINTTLCYIQKDSSYLMLHRVKKEKDYNKDKWIGVGGKFEETESPEECVCREVLEETGIHINPKGLEYRGIITFVSKNDGEPVFTEFMHLFWYDFSFNDESELKAPEECDEGDLQWVPISKMNDLPHWKGDEIFLEYLQKNVPFFSLKLIYENGNLIEYKSSIENA